ncbi:MAG TPA: DUF4350 domain-containing protein [Ramlibacter sp.]|uniref:DUF4350 domain-containing protein n=1 Tax=Ramlibacter sp. TaxID=1917967 RepID=UPI002ED0FD66
MSQSTVIRWVVIVLLALFGLWLVTATEWVEIEVDTPRKGEALQNEFFALERLARELGARVEKQQTLDRMPPPGAVLLLESPYWDMFPERPAKVRKWVEAGGHLVLAASALQNDQITSWVPVKGEKRPPKPKDAARARKDRDDPCRDVAERSGPGLADAGSYRVCAWPHWQQLNLQPAAAPPTWQVQGPEGIELVRLPVGQGSVTVYGPRSLLNNGEVVRTRSDHAALVARALQVERGKLLWVVPDEARPPLLLWIWQQGWAAVLLGAFAIAAWLWRGMVRFGPLGVVPPLQRRSMREQVAGTGSFLQHHGPSALHQAQVRALQETARARLPGYALLRGRAAVERIARATNLPASELETALVSRAERAPLAADLELLELARRRLHLSTSHYASQP